MAGRVVPLNRLLGQAQSSGATDGCTVSGNLFSDLREQVCAVSSRGFAPVFEGAGRCRYCCLHIFLGSSGYRANHSLIGRIDNCDAPTAPGWLPLSTDVVMPVRN